MGVVSWAAVGRALALSSPAGRGAGVPGAVVEEAIQQRGDGGGGELPGVRLASAAELGVGELVEEDVRFAVEDVRFVVEDAMAEGALPVR